MKPSWMIDDEFNDNKKCRSIHCDWINCNYNTNEICHNPEDIHLDSDGYGLICRQYKDDDRKYKIELTPEQKCARGMSIMGQSLLKQIQKVRNYPFSPAGRIHSPVVNTMQNLIEQELVKINDYNENDIPIYVVTSKGIEVLKCLANMNSDA